MQDDNKLGVWMCAALVVGSMIGTGIFMLPATLAPFGASSVLAWALTAGGTVFLALVFAALSRAFPHVEGPYAYTRMAFGDLTGFIAAWGYWVSLWVFNAAIATGATAYLGSLVPWIAGSTAASAATTLGFVWLLTAVNIYGVRAAGTVQVITTALKLVPLLAVAGLALWLGFRRSPAIVHSELMQSPLDLGMVTAAATLTLSAMVGFESAAVMSNKVRDPARNIPRSTLIGTIVTAIIYVVACTAVMMLIPGEQLAKSTAPFADVARQYWGPATAQAMALFVMISALGCLNAGILLQGELPLQMARNGTFPKLFLKESARQTPVAALCIGSVLVTILVMMNYQKTTVEIFAFMALLATTATLVLYLLCALALLALLRSGKLVAQGRSGAWLAVAGVLGTVYALWTIVGAGREAVVWGFVLLALGVPVFYVMRSRRLLPAQNLSE